jgi:galactosylceramidase
MKPLYLVWSPLARIVLFVVLILDRPAFGAPPMPVTLDGRSAGRVFEGIGCLSAGASSRLLIDYPEPQRSQILDLLFKPNHGAGFQHLKVEIGGDVNSTDGCEPSHRHTREDRNYERGYEWWLMKEARKRNPAIILDCLQWGAPAWIGNGHFYSQDNADYIVDFVQAARRVHGLDLSYVGVWNETRPDLGWIKLLRRTLDQSEMRDVKIVAADEINSWNIVELMKRDPELAQGIDVVGAHYPKFRSTPAARECGKPIWCSEDGPWRGNWNGAGILARQYSRNYVEGRMTKTIVWSPVTSYYDNLPLPGSGVMRANAPWSGHYAPQPALWATAHTTQFAQPGWQYLDDACLLLPEGGSLVTLRAPKGTDFSLIAETMGAESRQEISVQIRGGLSEGPLHVWRSDAQEQFVRREDIQPAQGRFTLVLEPNCLYSLTTTSGQAKGGVPPPPPTPFPRQHREDFESGAPGATPRYFSDQAGIFEVAPRADGKGRCLQQVIARKGIEWHLHLNPFPETFLGDTTWCDYEVAVDAFLDQEGFVSLFGRVGRVPQDAKLPEGYWLKLDAWGYWELGTAEMALMSGRAASPLKAWRRLRLNFVGSRITVSLDGQVVGAVTDETYASGMAGVGSGWHPAQFDNFEIQVHPADTNLARGKPTTASSVADVDWAAAHAVDGDPFTTRWMAAPRNSTGEWLEVDLGGDTRFNTAILRPFEERIVAYQIQYWDGKGWVDAYVGRNLGSAPKRVRFPAVTARRVRLLITAARAIPALGEFELSHRPEP